MNDKEMRDIESKATKGPWEANTSEQTMSDTQEYWFRSGFNAPKVFNAVMPRSDADFITVARKWVPDALDKFDKIRELHRPQSPSCFDTDGVNICRECRYDYPCDTIRILDGDEA